MTNIQFQVQFQEPIGPGPNFAPAPGTSVQHLVYRHENGQTPLASASMPSDAANSVPAKLPETLAADFPCDMDLDIRDPTMDKLLDLSSYLQRHKALTNIDQDNSASDSEDETNVDSDILMDRKVKRGPHGPYHEYNDKQWSDALFDLTNNFGSMSVTEVAKKHGINPRTARNKFMKYQEDPSKGFVMDKPRGGHEGCQPILQEEHTKFILDFFGDEPAREMHLLQDAIKEKFGLEVSESTLYRHVKKDCHLSLQRLQPQPEAQFAAGNKEARKTWVETWPSDETFLQKSVFIDEAGFNLYQRRLYGWCPKGGKKGQTKASEQGTSCEIIGSKYTTQPHIGFFIISATNIYDDGKYMSGDGSIRNTSKGSPTVKVPKLKSVNFSVLGAICWSGVINMVLRTPPAEPAPNTNKKRKVTGKNKAKDDHEQEQTQGTNANHFLMYIGHVMDVLDKYDLKGMNLVMDNASIHKTDHTQAYIRSRGYTPVFLPPYSPFLNPIEEFWAQMKHVFRRQKLGEDTVQRRLAEAAAAVTLDNIRGYIRNAHKKFPACIRMEDL